ncbi:MAG: tetratricopeptide repeat protein [Gallionellaceae bacterium]|jgi:MSHA biogenesis protein MshN
MSLINQVLNDLEKRGANSPLVEMPVRAVPMQNRLKVSIYIALGAAIIGGASVVGWTLYKLAVNVPPLPVALSPAVESEEAPLAALRPPASQPNEQIDLPVEAADAQIASGVAFRLSFELASIPVPKTSQEDLVAQSGKRSAASAVAANATQKAVQSAAKKPPAVTPPSINKEMKIVSTLQQAENEFRRGNQFVQQRRLREAAAAYEAALVLNPAHVMAREYWVAVLLESKLNSEAEKVLQLGLKSNPGETHFAMLLARLQVERNALPAALETLEQMLAYADQRADYNAFYAAILQRQNRHKEAVTHYEIALNMLPSSGVWFMGLGISLQALDRKEDARNAYMRALDTRSLSQELQAYIEQRMKELKSK